MHPSYRTYKAIKRKDYQEVEIDEAINRAKEKGYSKVVEFGAKGLNYAAKAVLSGAMLGQDFLVDRLGKRSSSMFELNRRSQVGRLRLGAGDILDYDEPDFASTFRGLSNVPEDSEHFIEESQSVSSNRSVSTRRTNVAQVRSQ
ncbi:unnamed protein product [Trichobilharzia regenti]|nr:unnamed protein product [Trichobilharzia regenti]